MQTPQECREKLDRIVSVFPDESRYLERCLSVLASGWNAAERKTKQLSDEAKVLRNKVEAMEKHFEQYKADWFAELDADQEKHDKAISELELQIKVLRDLLRFKFGG